MKSSILSDGDIRAINDYVVDGKLSGAHADLRDKIPRVYGRLISDLLAIDYLVSHDSFLGRKMRELGYDSAGIRKFYQGSVGR